MRRCASSSRTRTTKLPAKPSKLKGLTLLAVPAPFEYKSTCGRLLARDKSRERHSQVSTSFPSARARGRPVRARLCGCFARGLRRFNGMPSFRHSRLRRRRRSPHTHVDGKLRLHPLSLLGFRATRAQRLPQWPRRRATRQRQVFGRHLLPFPRNEP